MYTYSSSWLDWTSPHIGSSNGRNNPNLLYPARKKIDFIKNDAVSMILYTEINTVALVRKEKKATHRWLVEKATIYGEDNGQ